MARASRLTTTFAALIMILTANVSYHGFTSPDHSRRRGVCGV